MAHIFLDLDGTLVDPKLGITSAFTYALNSLNLPHPGELDWIIGPSLLDSFTRLGAPDPHEALRLYRKRYTDTGMFACHVYDGIPQALQALKAAGHSLYLATAKPHVYAKQITAHFGLAGYLTQEYGPELDGTRNDKDALLAYALQDLNLPAASCAMVGDRSYDYNAARAVGMGSVAVNWGYGSAQERALADVSCDDPAGLVVAIDQLLST